MRFFSLLGGFVAAAILFGAAQAAEPVVKLWRLDCGQIHFSDLNFFSDTQAYTGRSMQLVASCYLIQHGDSYLIWDTGLPAADLGKKIDPKAAMSDTVSITIVDQLKQLGLTPDRIADVGISHYHADHTGQAASFPKARLLIGKADLEALASKDDPRAKPLAPWLKDGGKIDAVSGDRDIYGDGTVVMIALPGHTPGHHGLLLRLKTGPVLLSGDVAHFRENYETNGLPDWNSNRADSLASMDRVRALVKNTGALFIIQHDPADIAKLPAFPKAAE
ncbi:MAG: N-acyl homoserine lactonase family protein [Rhizomicrobium sp.]|nr:N-acyl homoserine lactonase family protein [Rhizomicrobium sp.]